MLMICRWGHTKGVCSCLLDDEECHAFNEGSGSGNGDEHNSLPYFKNIHGSGSGVDSDDWTKIKAIKPGKCSKRLRCGRKRRRKRPKCGKKKSRQKLKCRKNKCRKGLKCGKNKCRKRLKCGKTKRWKQLKFGKKKPRKRLCHSWEQPDPCSCNPCIKCPNGTVGLEKYHSRPFSYICIPFRSCTPPT